MPDAGDSILMITHGLQATVVAGTRQWGKDRKEKLYLDPEETTAIMHINTPIH